MRKVLTDKRVVIRFLFLPKTINKEWRWLELVGIEQELVINKGVWKYIDINWV